MSAAAARWPERGLLSAAAFALAALDQAAKRQMEAFLLQHDGFFPVLPFFDLRLAYNRGAAFGLLADAGRTGELLLLTVSAVASALLLVWLWWPTTGRLAALGAALVLGGALGNLYDRLLMSPVIDYLYFHLGARGFPAFNLADIAISTGAALLVLHCWKGNAI